MCQKSANCSTRLKRALVKKESIVICPDVIGVALGLFNKKRAIESLPPSLFANNN